MMHPIYPYRKLDPPTTLRLIKLRPPTPLGQRKAPLECELFELPPNGTKAYQAISWCWGPEPMDEWKRELVIHENGQLFSFKISEHLDDTLRALRYDYDPRIIWIDVISINQRDLGEKSIQIPLMSSIYPKAEEVWVWLGKEDKDKYSTRAIKFIRSKVLDLWQFDELCSPKDEDDLSEDWHAFIELLNRPWFSRKWVVQEISLASKAMVQCGDETISWQEFSDAVSLFIEAESKNHRLSEVMSSSKTYRRTHDFFGHIPALPASILVDTTRNLFRRSKDGGREPISSLEYLVSSLSIFKASEPRDIIYAVLAVAKDALPHAEGDGAEDEGLTLTESPEVQRQLQAWAKARAKNFAVHSYYVDYERPIVDVYQDFVLFAIRKAEKPRALDIILRPWAAEAVDLPAGQMLPSWICTQKDAPFDGAWRPRGGMRMNRKNADPLVGTPDVAGRNYTATGSRSISASEFRFKKTPNYFSMFVEGFVLDEISEADQHSNTSESGIIPQSWRNYMWRSKAPPPKSQADSEIDDDFWRTLVGDRGPDGRNPPSFYPRACREVFLKVGTPRGAVDTKERIHEDQCTVIGEFLRRVQAVIWNRRMIRTKYLEKLGLCPSETRGGDLICILYGCSVPVILRKIPKSQEQIDADVKLEKEDRDKAAVIIQQRWRTGQRRAKRPPGRKRDLMKELAFEFLRPYWGARGFHVLSAAMVMMAVSLFSPLDVQAWLQTVWLGMLLSLVGSSKTLLSLDARVTLAFITSLACGPILMSLKHKMRILRKTIARWCYAGKSSELPDPKVPDHYFELVGECYVQGMMAGEAISLQNEEIIRLKKSKEGKAMPNGKTQSDDSSSEEEKPPTPKKPKPQTRAQKKKERKKKKQEQEKLARQKTEPSRMERFRSRTFEIR